jgi:phenylalanyl-tRNA synthetase beta chain
MRVPLSWLADFVDVDLPVDELAVRLTMIGLKVETIHRTGAGWQDVVIGQVTSAEPHPKSNRPLWIAKVDLGTESITVVTGAPNVRKGDMVPVVRVGGTLPHGPDGSPMTIQAKPMAGVASEGMLCSQRELGISDEHSGIYILSSNAPVGQPLESILGDEVLEIETNANRPDTLSIVGIAREVAAMTQQQISLPDVEATNANVTLMGGDSIAVEIEDPDLCSRYTALRIEGVGSGTTPSWLASRLEAAGMRPISLLVDITNYVMLELGQPMHAFDARRLRGNRIIVRRAREGEHLRTLDDVERALSPENLVIADAERAVALAGVMGGEDSEIADDTDAIVLESATFDRISVRRTAKALGLRTDASVRFEKGLPPEQTVLAARRYVQLLAQILERPIRVADISDRWVGVPEKRVVSMPLRDLHRLTGLQIPAERAAETLSLLDFGVRAVDGAIEAEIPYWRRADIELSADLVEEVIRLVGYDTIPLTLPRRTISPPAPLPELAWERSLADVLLAAGVNESVTHSLTSPEAMARLSRVGTDDYFSQEFWAELIPNPAGVYARGAETRPYAILNPSSRDRQVVRITLLPGLIDALARNLRQSDERVAFFEIARTIFPQPDELGYERRTLAIALGGNRRPRTWQDAAPAPFTFFDVKGLLEESLDAMQLQDWTVRPHVHPALHPGRSATLRLDGRGVAYFGELHPAVAQRFEIQDWRVQVAEVDLDTLFERATDARTFHPPPRYPAAYRDIAVVVDEVVPADAVLRVIDASGRELLESRRLFDVYAGSQLPEGKKSIAIGLTFRAPGATLTQDEVADVMGHIVNGLSRELRASIRD